MNAIAAPASLRVRIFVDFWNFTLSLRREEAGFMLDWMPVGPLMTAEAGKLVDPATPAKFEAIHVYGSFDPAKANDGKLKHWFSNTLDRMPGTHVVLVERQQKRGYPACPNCYGEATNCASCGSDMRGTAEKGVDTRIVADMISLAWEKAYDVAVLVSSDRDFVPVAEFLQSKGIKVIHAAFPPKGSNLSQKCWASFKVSDIKEQMRRPAKQAVAAK